MHHFWHNNSIGVEICGGVMSAAMLYLFFVDGDSFAGWTVFFIFLVLTILFYTVDQQHKEIEALRKPKDENVDVDEKTNN